MKMRLFLCLMAFAVSRAQDQYKDFKMVEIQVENVGSRNELFQLEYNADIDIIKEGEVGGTSFALLPPGQEGQKLLTKLRKSRLAYQITDVDFGELVLVEQQHIETRRMLWDSHLRQEDDRPVQFDINNFHSHEEINNYVNDLAAAYPFVNVISIGTTFEGREQLAIQICMDECGTKPALWVDAGIHAREWISPAAVIYMTDYLIQTLPDSEKDLIQDVDWMILPVFNADGYEFTRLQTHGDRMWRKTRSINPGSSCIGVDANRNFGTGWGQDSGSSPIPCSFLYRGSYPFSEVETANVRDFLLSPAASQVRLYQNQHAPFQMITYPWAYVDNVTEECTESGNSDIVDQEALASLGRQAIFDVNQTFYELGMTCTQMYPASGMAPDWAYAEAGIKYSYTVELQPGMNHPNNDFLVDPEDIQPNGEEMIAFHSVMARQIALEFSSSLS